MDNSHQYPHYQQYQIDLLPRHFHLTTFVLAANARLLIVLKSHG